ncbi:MAG: metallophosphoesterase family protein [Beijerinckiaceae bacterium]
MILDPRNGDAEDDRSSPKARTLTALAGGFLAEISIVKALFVFLLLVVLPNIILGFAPLVVSAWLSTMSAQVRAATSVGSIAAATGLMVFAWYLWRPAFGVLETNFWALNAILVQPGYMLCREAIRHAIRMDDPTLSREDARIRRDKLAAFGAGTVAVVVGLAVIWVAWPLTRWSGSAIDLVRPSRLVVPALANSIVLSSAYAAAACLIWAVADGTMDTARDLPGFDRPVDGAKRWRIAHLSDLHAVGEEFGYRIESGRGGPRGNGRLAECLAALAEAHRREPLDLVLITGDMTDAGRSSEWAAFFDILARYPDIAAMTSIIPGNHDLNIIDRANPARLELPWAAGKRLRRMRMLSAMERQQGSRARVVDLPNQRLGGSLTERLSPFRRMIADFAESGSVNGALTLDRIWDESFPQIVPPATPDGLGLILIDTNADVHFSFTNALGVLRAREALGIEIAMRAYPQAVWIIAIHHHLVEYPRASGSLSIRIGTALINGAWVVRQLKRHRERIVVMHGHRHVDWTGSCEGVRIISAPSPVMAAAGYFRIQTLQSSVGGLQLLAPGRIDVPRGSNVTDRS